MNRLPSHLIIIRYVLIDDKGAPAIKTTFPFKSFLAIVCMFIMMLYKGLQVIYLYHGELFGTFELSCFCCFRNSPAVCPVNFLKNFEKLEGS